MGDDSHEDIAGGAAVRARRARQEGRARRAACRCHGDADGSERGRGHPRHPGPRSAEIDEDGSRQLPGLLGGASLAVARATVVPALDDDTGASSSWSGRRRAERSRAASHDAQRRRAARLPRDGGGHCPARQAEGAAAVALRTRAEGLDDLRRRVESWARCAASIAPADRRAPIRPRCQGACSRAGLDLRGAHSSITRSASSCSISATSSSWGSPQTSIIVRMSVAPSTCASTKPAR